jgi:hypothetical protein
MNENNTKIAVLFVEKKSIYKSHEICDCYDKERDALTFNGSESVIAHPPCRLWGRLYKFAKGEPGEEALSVWAVNKVRMNGGVLEHPAYSRLWKHMNLPTGKRLDGWGGFTMSINQHWFGHRAEKKTFLYIVGISPDEVPEWKINFNAVTHTICSSKKKTGKKEVNKTERQKTPEAMALFLIEIAKRVEVKKKLILTN